MPPIDDFPLKIENVTYAAYQEWRVGDRLPERESDGWQLVFVHSGAIEELCGRKKTAVRTGGILLHAPHEVHAMTTLGVIPPEVLRIEFTCSSPAMELFRGRAFHADAAEQVSLVSLRRAVKMIFDNPQNPGDFPTLRRDRPYGSMQQICNYLEVVLIMLARRVQTVRKPGRRAGREQQMNALVDEAKMYFARNIGRPLRLEQVCEAVGVSRQQLQEAFRLRLRRGPMEELAAMRIQYAEQLLARGVPPGEVAQRLGYCSGAYFTRSFKRATGHTPSEYRRIQNGLMPKKRKKDEKTEHPSIATNSEEQ